METEMEASSQAAGQSSSPDTSPTHSSPLTQTTHSLSSSSVSVPLSVSPISPEDQDHAHAHTYAPAAPAVGANTDPNNLDDIFGPPSPPLSPSHTHTHIHTYDQHKHIDPSDSPRLRSIHSTAGYRDGISAAREAAVQGGFDEGYLLGAALGLRVGVLRGVVRGLVQGLGTSQGVITSQGLGTSLEPGAGAPKPNPEVVDRIQALAERMRRDLVLENVLGPAFVLPDGSWRWDVDEEDVAMGGVHAVAEAHPLVRAYAGVVGRWVRVLGVRRVGERDGDGGGG